MTGVGSAQEELYVKWERPTGEIERVPAAAFDRRSDTPAVSELDLEAAQSPPCCTSAEILNFCVKC